MKRKRANWDMNVLSTNQSSFSVCYNMPVTSTKGYKKWEYVRAAFVDRTINSMYVTQTHSRVKKLWPRCCLKITKRKGLHIIPWNKQQCSAALEHSTSHWLVALGESKMESENQTVDTNVKAGQEFKESKREKTSRTSRGKQPEATDKREGNEADRLKETAEREEETAKKKKTQQRQWDRGWNTMSRTMGRTSDRTRIRTTEDG